jgi:RNA polymerase sigma factor (sigma-70 family)
LLAIVSRTEITKDAFDHVLSWLHHDREEAGRRYERIRASLIKIFVWRGCSDAEDLADETINRVTKKISELAPIYTGDPALYFYGVAKNLFREVERTQRLKNPLSTLKDEPTYVPSIDILIEKETEDLLYMAQRECLEKLPERERKLILEYYDIRGADSFERRKELAKKFGMSVNTLRVRMHRIRVMLERCIKDRLEG